MANRHGPVSSLKQTDVGGEALEATVQADGIVQDNFGDQGSTGGGSAGSGSTPSE